MKKKIYSKGAALIEYAVLLSFVSVIALSFISDNDLMRSISGVINKANSIINTNNFSEAALKDALVGLKNSDYKTYQYASHINHIALGSDFRIDDAFVERSQNASQNFEKNFLSKINFGDVSLDSWRFLNESQTDQNSPYAYLIWSDTDWGSGNYRTDEGSKTACMYARIDKKNNTVQYGVAYANPLYVHDADGTINGWRTGDGGMVNINEGLTSNLKFDNNWENKSGYLAADSPYFTSDYQTATKLYKELQAKSQSK